jgi:septum formation protein
MRLILASQSAGRKKVLESLGLKFEVIPAHINEGKYTADSPPTLVKKIARAKAIAILKKTKFPALIIAADSMVVFAGKTFGKPRTKQEGKEFLEMFSGKTHEFLTGIYIINTKTNKRYQDFCKTRVSFAKLTEKEINNFVKVADVTSFAGGYTYDLEGGEILRPEMKIIGSETNMAGLPLEKILPILRKNRIKIKKGIINQSFR